MKKILALILSLCMVFALLAGCGDDSNAKNSDVGSQNTESPSKAPVTPEEVDADKMHTIEQTEANGGLYLYDEWPADSVTIGCSGDGNTLSPFGRPTFGNVGARDIIFQKLLRIDTEGNNRLEMAKEIIEEDELTYRIILWDNIRDSAGNRFTANDVVFSIETYVATGQRGGVSRLADLPEGQTNVAGGTLNLEVVSDTELIWHCAKPFAIGEMAQQMSNANMVCQAAYEASTDNMTTNPVGTGPYMLKSFNIGTGCTLVANEDYWMKELPEDVRMGLWIYSSQNVREINIQIIKEASARAIALEQGTVAAADKLSDVDVDNLSKRDDMAVSLIPQDIPVAFIFNCSDESPCSDIRIRQAICYAINSAAIAEGVSCPAVATYAFQPTMFDSPDEWSTGREYYDYNVETAKKLLQEAGYSGQTLNLMYVGGTSAAHDDAAILIQSQLREIGLKVELKKLEQSVYETKEYVPGEWDMRMDTWGGSNYCVGVYKYFYTGYQEENYKGNNLMLIKDDKLDQLYLDLEADPENVDKLVALDAYFNEQCYGLGVISYFTQTVSSASVTPALGDRGFLCANAFLFHD
ncbi:MAG: ABC transporter substrate-binding protein [Oscillospiraceae bacterium]